MITRATGFSELCYARFIETRLNDPPYLPYLPYISYIGKRHMSFGATGNNFGQQGTNSGNIAVGHQLNGWKWMQIPFQGMENGFSCSLGILIRVNAN